MIGPLIVHGHARSNLSQNVAALNTQPCSEKEIELSRKLVGFVVLVALTSAVLAGSQSTGHSPSVWNPPSEIGSGGHCSSCQ